MCIGGGVCWGPFSIAASTQRPASPLHPRNTTKYLRHFEEIGSGDSYSALCAGASHCLALERGGKLHAWGEGKSGQTGLEEASGFERLPRPLEGMSFRAVSAGGFHCVALNDAGQVTRPHPLAPAPWYQPPHLHNAVPVGVGVGRRWARPGHEATSTHDPNPNPNDV